MNFHGSLSIDQKPKGHFIFWINIIFSVIFLLFLMFFLSGSSKMTVRIPRVITSDIVNNDNITIIITSENVVYCHGRIFSIDDLRSWLSQDKNRSRPILIKADQRASVGRIVDVWDLARDLGIDRVNIATDHKG